MAQKRNTKTRATVRTTPAYQEQDNSVDSVQAGWGPLKMQMKGEQVIVIFVLLSAVAALGTLLLRVVDSPVEAITDQTKLLSEQHARLVATVDQHQTMNDVQHKALVETQRRIAESLEATVFYLSKEEKERKKYKIEMPDSLRRKLTEESYNQLDRQ